MVKEILNKVSIIFIVIVMITLFMHGKIPYMLPLSVISLCIAVFFVLLDNQAFSEIKKSVKIYIKISWSYMAVSALFVIIGIVYLAAYSKVFSEAVYAIYIGFVVFIIFYLNNKRSISRELNYFFVNVYLIFIFGLCISFYYSLFFIGKWKGLAFGSEVDYNILAYTFLSGFVILLFKSVSFKKIWYLIVTTFSLLIIAIPIFASGSRRGILVFLLIHVFLFLYFIVSYFKRKTNRNISIYISTILLLIVGLFLATNNTKNLRIYVVDNYFYSGKKTIKAQYSNIFNRYTSIINEDSNRREKTKNYWKLKPYSGKGIIDKWICSKEKEALISFFNSQQYYKAFQKVKSLRFYSNSKENFINYIPDEYKSIINAADEYSLGFDYVPYTFSIPYIEKDFLTLGELGNLFLINEPVEYNSVFQFVSAGAKDNSLKHISSRIILFPNMYSIITFLYSGISSDSLRFSFKGINSKGFVDFSEKDSILGNGVIQKTIIVKTDNILPAFYRWNIYPTMSASDTFTLKLLVYKRTPIKEVKYELIQDKDVRLYVTAQKRRIKQYKIIHHKYLLESKNLVRDEKENLISILNKFNEYAMEFSSYGSYSKLISKTDSTWLFKVAKVDSIIKVYSLLPAITGARYNISLKVKSDKKPEFRLKRYPEASPHFFNKEIEESSTELVQDGIYQINLKYSISGSASALSALVIGVSNVFNGVGIEIFDLVFKQSLPTDTIITKYQYSFLYENYNQILKEESLGESLEQNIQYMEFKKELNLIGNIMGSRTERWQFAWFYFKQQKWYKQLFGSGFEYLKIYSQIFKKPNVVQEYDYPHNPIISAFLYSGILGGLLYIYFLGLSFYRYWKLRKELALFGMLYILAFAFTFFSGNSHFSVPAFALLSLLPFAFSIKREKITH